MTRLDKSTFYSRSKKVFELYHCEKNTKQCIFATPVTEFNSMDVLKIISILRICASE